MDKDIIFCFTGTGNSLKVSKDIAASLGDCTIYHMGSANTGFNVSDYKRIGFVFPVYFLGLPLHVKRFIEELKSPPEFDGYFFSIGTYANVKGNAVKQVDALLQKRGQRLDYAAYIKMGDNAIAFYDSHFNLEKLTASYKRNMAVIIPEISEKRSQRMGRKLKLVERYHDMMIPRMANRDRGFQIIDTCNNCGLCMEACPVGNIVITNSKPDFRHNCEQCMACIQWCPVQAINYKTKTAGKRRYNHPSIRIDEMLLRNEPYKED